ncbi:MULTISPECIES: hypothetical protein [Methylobacteriaceae]|uniref:hypothetical protein n=1 Tax=Methylobacteriaceae TaxID=119045 RepID=UPI000CDA492D|nr:MULTISPECIES: hypothetical protein [Methylobacteriaceae]MCP1549438.1 hypothetical protein [Methylorubrum zatmanii]MCP1553949.1 hypothetical protein [Methylorubrum extorquens]MCP1579740.1 hypothetical protein [Methylorubrum extorquens]POR41004.1 hypothetical protein CRT23_21165 [Methylobacterium sp. V23]
MTRLVLLVLIAASLSGCHAGKPNMSGFPDSLLTCSGAPRWKGGTQRDVAGFVEDLGDAHADCAGKLGEVRGIVRGGKR